MRDELLETILHTYRHLRDEINKLRQENLETRKEIKEILKIRNKFEPNTPSEMSLKSENISSKFERKIKNKNDEKIKILKIKENFLNKIFSDCEHEINLNEKK